MNQSDRVLRGTPHQCLPVELWFIIFDYFLVGSDFTVLAKLRGVSKEWKEVIHLYFGRFRTLQMTDRQFISKRFVEKTLLLFKGLEVFIIKDSGINSRFLQTCLDRKPDLKEMALIRVRNISRGSIPSGEQEMNYQLQSLILNTRTLDEWELGKLFNFFAGARKVRILGFTGTIIGRELQKIHNSLKDLEFDLSKISSSKSGTLNQLMMSNARLVEKLTLHLGEVQDELGQTINLAILSNNLQNITSLSLSFETLQPYDLVPLSNLVGLESIDLEELSNDYAHSSLTDEGLRPIFENSHNLKKIRLSGRNTSTNRITRITLRSIAENCEKVVSFRVNNANNLYDRDMREISGFKSLRFLEVVKSHFITNDSIRFLWTRCYSLTKLCIVDCQRIDFPIVITIISLAKIECEKGLSNERLYLIEREFMISNLRCPFRIDKSHVPDNLKLKINDGIYY